MRKRLLAFLMVLCLCQMPQMVWAAEVTEKMPQGTETEKLTEAETVPESEKQTETEKNQSESEQTESNQSDVIFQIVQIDLRTGGPQMFHKSFAPLFQYLTAVSYSFFGVSGRGNAKNFESS